MKEPRVLMKHILLTNVFGHIAEHFWAPVSPYVKKEVIFALPYRDIITIKHVSVYIKKNSLHVLKIYTNIRYYFPIVTRTLKAFSIKI